MIDKDQILKEFQKFKWSEIISKTNSLDDLNDQQWRFIKGLSIELIVEKYSGDGGLKYVGEPHKDFDWPRLNLSVELKSITSSSMYKQNGKLRKNFYITFNNSHGTNKKNKLDPNDVADFLLVIKNDGAFFADKETVIRCGKMTGDGVKVVLSKTDIVEITGKLTVNKTVSLDLKNTILNAIRSHY